jgi:acetyl-CoA C-acetyltransferase/3-oxo-5,6-didehydrosuberyl-CoA/3-oxoadipyl-CoA thiolase
MTRAPFVMLKPDASFPRGNQMVWDTTLGWRMVNPRLAELYPPISLGETAENLARQYHISREEQDEFALDSHRRAVAAQDACRFSSEVVPVEVPRGKGESIVVQQDEGPRRDTSLEKLERLKPAFVEGGTVTAGNSSQLNDGSSALLLTSGKAAQELNLQPLARFIDAATAGVDPSVMGFGPVPATRKLLGRLGLQVDDLDVVELNEAFAAQVLACVKELKLDRERLNPNGGAIAIGHPLGASGARLVTTLIYELQRRGGRYGLATMCIGVGQGISALFERVEA